MLCSICRRLVFRLRGRWFAWISTQPTSWRYSVELMTIRQRFMSQSGLRKTQIMCSNLLRWLMAVCVMQTLMSRLNSNLSDAISSWCRTQRCVAWKLRCKSLTRCSRASLSQCKNQKEKTVVRHLRSIVWWNQWTSSLTIWTLGTKSAWSALLTSPIQMARSKVLNHSTTLIRSREITTSTLWKLWCKSSISTTQIRSILSMALALFQPIWMHRKSVIASLLTVMRLTPLSEALTSSSELIRVFFIAWNWVDLLVLRPWLDRRANMSNSAKMKKTTMCCWSWLTAKFMIWTKPLKKLPRLACRTSQFQS